MIENCLVKFPTPSLIIDTFEEFCKKKDALIKWGQGWAFGLLSENKQLVARRLVKMSMCHACLPRPTGAPRIRRDKSNVAE